MMRYVPRAGLLPAFGLLPGLALIGLAAMTAPAAAQLNGVVDQFQDMRNSLGFGPARPPMDFSERPPLVVPPNDTLPPPGSGQMSIGVTDTDINNRRKALTDSRRPVPPSDPGSGVSGLSGRAYLIDPPAGMRDPSTLGPEPSHSTSKAGKYVEKAHHRGHRRTPAPVEAAQ